MEEKTVTMISPWINYYREVEALFEPDPYIDVFFDDENYILKLFVKGTEKALALQKLLPEERTFGNVTVKVMVIPANYLDEDTTVLELFELAFKDNPALIFTETAPRLFGTMDFVVFDNKVVQYDNDDIGDYNMVKSTLYEDIARDVFKGKNVHFSTWMSPNLEIYDEDE